MADHGSMTDPSCPSSVNCTTAMAQTASVHVRFVLSVTTCPLCLVGYALSVSSGRAAACGVGRGARGADPHVDPDAAGAQQVADELDVPGGHVGTLGHVR